MQKYTVEMKETRILTFEVEAENEVAATEEAHQSYRPVSDEPHERAVLFVIPSAE